jgi:lactoylglutathione lyase
VADEATAGVNVQQTVPLLAVSDMEASLRFYVDGLGFEVRNRWSDDGSSGGAGSGLERRR